MNTLTVLLIFVGITFLLALLNWKNREKPPSEEEIHEGNVRFQRWKKAKQDWDATDKNEYMPHRHAVDWKKRHAGIPKVSERILKDLSHDDRDVYTKAVQLMENHEQKRKQRNKKFIAKRLSDRREWFDQLNEHPLTPAQRRAVVVNEDNTLVVAAAGTGKTTTLEAKAAYMVDQGLCKPEEILVMAFNKKVAEEVSERISRNPSLSGVTVKTFHALGSQIIGHCRGAIPALSPLAENQKARLQLFKGVFQENLQQDAFRREIQTWFTDNLVERAWVEKHAPTERFTALNGEIVASVSEVMVANWLLMNGIEFKHEKNYPHQHNSPRHRDYLPDFYLPQIDAWLEVWAVDGNGNTAPHIDAERYVETMTWKREFHQQHDTVLLEIDQDQVWSGRLGGYLESLLTAHGLVPQPLTIDQFRALTDNSFTINNFCTLIETYIQLFRSGDYKETTVKKRAQSEREKAFIRLVDPFMEAYVHALKSQARIDFHDMLLQAGSLVNEKKYDPEWRCILVDETQDFSGARMELVKALKTHGPDVSVVLVGDDWQSIYRFTGADVSFFTEANKHLGFTERVDLDETFRLAADVHHLSERFVTKNPIQLKKSVRPARETSKPGVAIHLHIDTGGGDNWQVARQLSAEEALKQVLAEIQAEARPKDSVLILGRYSHVIHDLKKRTKNLSKEYNLDIKAMTVHKSKGLEADHVIVLDLSKGTYGFPAEVTDDPILQLVQATPDAHAFAEERRLFYVATTRTKNRVFFIAPFTRQSLFIEELLKEEEYSQFIELVGLISEAYLCPKPECRGKTVLRKEGRYGSFWGCARYPRCNGKLQPCWECNDMNGVLEPVFNRDVIQHWQCSACSNQARACPHSHCQGGVLLRKDGPRGHFYGCSNWKRDRTGCNYTLNN